MIQVSPYLFHAQVEPDRRALAQFVVRAAKVAAGGVEAERVERQVGGGAREAETYELFESWSRVGSIWLLIG